MKIKKGDLVIVKSGDDAGSTPRRVVTVLAGGRRLVVEGVNRAYKNVKRGHPKSPQGGRLQMELPIDASNVQFYCGSCNKATRLGLRYSDDGGKERFCRRCGTGAGTISPARPQYAKK